MLSWLYTRGNDEAKLLCAWLRLRRVRRWQRRVLCPECGAVRRLVRVGAQEFVSEMYECPNYPHRAGYILESGVLVSYEKVAARFSSPRR